MNEDVWRKPIQRPIGVIIILILSLLSALRGVAGFFFTIRAAEGEVALPFVIVSLILIFGFIGSAIWAFFPHVEARISYIVLLILNILWPAVFLFSAVVGDDKEVAKEAMQGLMGIVLQSLYVIGIVAYFMTAGVVAYYKQHERNQ